MIIDSKIMKISLRVCFILNMPPWMLYYFSSTMSIIMSKKYKVCQIHKYEAHLISKQMNAEK